MPDAKLVSLGSLVMRRRQTWLFVALGIILNCVFAVPPRLDGVGGSASVAVPPRPDGVRAGIMGILMVLGPAFGRRSMALNSLAISVPRCQTGLTCSTRSSSTPGTG